MPRSSPNVVRLSPDERAALETTSRRYTSPYRDVVRAKIILMAAAGLENKTIASRLGMPVQVICKWRKRFCQERLRGLKDRPRESRGRW